MPPRRIAGALLSLLLQGNSKAPVSAAFRPQPAGLFAVFCGSKGAKAGNGSGLGISCGIWGKMGCGLGKAEGYTASVYPDNWRELGRIALSNP